MQEAIELIKAISSLIWPICLLLIVFMFRREIRNLLLSLLLRKKDESETVGDTLSKTQMSESISSDTDAFPLHEADKLKPDTQIKVKVCKNKISKSDFILLDENGNKIYCITPECKLIWLDKDLFSDYEDVGADHLPKEQLEIFYWWIQNPEPYETKSEKVKDPPISGYLPSYMRMLMNPSTEPSKMLRYIKSRRIVSWSEAKNYLHDTYGYELTSGSMGASLKALETLGHVRIDGQGENKKLLSKD